MNPIYLKRIILAAVMMAILVPGGLIYRQFKADMFRAKVRIATGSQIIDTACGPVQYAEFGSGAPMLMIHGAGGGYDQGIYMAKAIGGNYRWIAPSRFGYLDTPVPDNASSELQADAHACLLDALGIDKVGVVGVSAGGPSALLFAQRYPERTTALVMVNAISHAMPARPAYLSTLFSAFTNDFVFWSLVKTNKEALLSALGVPDEDQKSFDPAILAETYHFLETFLPMSARKNGQMLEQRMSEYDAEQIQNIQAPTLVIHARNDTLVAFDQGEYTAQHVPGAQMIEMERGGHMALLFYPDMRAKLVDFLKQ